MWSEPEEPNGVIQGYYITFGDYGNYRGHEVESTLSNMKELMDLCKCLRLYACLAHPSFHHHSILTVPETPINVTVQAKNTVGLGNPSSITLFTKEGGLYNIMFIPYVHVLSKIKVDL